MIQSRQVQEWQEEALIRGRKEEAAESILEALGIKFGAVPDDVADHVRAVDDLLRLKHLHRLAVRTTSLDEFRKELSNSMSHG